MDIHAYISRCHIYICAHTIVYGVVDASARLVNNNKIMFHQVNMSTLEHKKKKSSIFEKKKKSRQVNNELDVDWTTQICMLVVSK